MGIHKYYLTTLTGCDAVVCGGDTLTSSGIFLSHTVISLTLG